MKLKVTMTLLSDTILSTGQSMPGGDDITVVTDDEKGFPYLKSTSFKGLFREALENLLLWDKNLDITTLEALLGTPGIQPQDEHRRLQFTNLTITDTTIAPERCFSKRAFTAIENGIVKTGSLRTASCIKSGIVFEGYVFCHESDKAIVVQALRAIKYIGTMRSRGFGRVHFKAEEVEEPETTNFSRSTSPWIEYTLDLKSPLLISDYSESDQNNIATRKYISGAAIRGFVINQLIKKNPTFFAEHRLTLLKYIRFLPAFPVKDDSACIPSPKGFYEDKIQTILESVFSGDITPGFKRATLGDFCSLAEKNTLIYWKTETTRITRIHIKNKEMFSVDVIAPGQQFVGYIYAENADLALEVQKTLQGDIFIGADKYEGFGHCHAQCKAVSQPSYFDYCRISSTDKTLYMLSLSPLAMTDELGDPCGLNEKQLAKRLQVENVTLEACSTSTSSYGGFNKTWGCRVPEIAMYQEGTIFKLCCSSVPDSELLLDIQRTGLGIKCEEGFGQVLFINPEVANISQKRKWVSSAASELDKEKITARRARIKWIHENNELLNNLNLSLSQKGDIHEWIVHASNNGTAETLLSRISEAIVRTEKRADTRIKTGYQAIDKLLKTALDKNNQTISFCTGATKDRLDLLVELFAYHQRYNAGKGWPR